MTPSYEFAYAMEEELGLGLISGLFSSIPSGILGIATYVLTALALYTIAKRRGIHHPWMSWVPVLNVWILGSISDQYRYVVKGEVKSKRKSLLTLSIISAVLSLAVIVIAVVMVFNIIGGAVAGAQEVEMIEDAIGSILGIVGAALPLAGVGIAHAILYYMALYDVYTSMDPGNNVLFLVLSIIFHVTEPFFLFFNRNKDLGMPPRRQEPSYIPPQEPQWQPQQPVQEPWNEENKDYL